MYSWKNTFLNFEIIQNSSDHFHYIHVAIIYIAIRTVLLSNWWKKTICQSSISLCFILPKLLVFISYIVSIWCRLEIISIHIYVRYFIFKAYVQMCVSRTLPMSQVIFHLILKRIYTIQKVTMHIGLYFQK